MKVIAIANRKGGCGKTATAVNLAACLGQQGRRVLLIDTDIESHAALRLGVAAASQPGMYEVFNGAAVLAQAVISDAAHNVDLIPGAAGLMHAERLLANGRGRELALRKQLAAADEYDYVIIDTPPMLDTLTVNALCAADRVLVPVELGPHALDGVTRLRGIVAGLRERYGLAMGVTLLPSMLEPRTHLARTLLSEMRARWPRETAPLEIRRTVKVNEAAQQGLPLIDYAPHAAATAGFVALADLMMGHRIAPRAAIVDAAPAETGQRVPNLTFSESMDSDHGRRVVLSYHHPAHKDMQIAGDFNDWIPDQDVETRVVNDTLQKVLKVAPGSYEYRVIIDGKWQEDPANPQRVPNRAGGSNSLLRVIP